MQDVVILFFDLFGTAVFAATGAIQGVRNRLDIFGVTVLACCVGVGGGIIRDCIIGYIPVAVLRSQQYMIICISVGLLTFSTARYWIQNRNLVKICDAIGLGVFTAIGAQKGAQMVPGFTGTVLCGMFTAIGGGMIRDVLTGKVPVVLKSDFYATASLIGGIVYFLLGYLDIFFFPKFAFVTLLVTSIRLFAVYHKIKLPSAGRFNVKTHKS